MAAWDDMVLVGRIARPHGIRGQVVINPETDFVEQRFAAGATFWTQSDRGEEQLTVSSVRLQGGRPVVAFEGCSRIEDVERLAGLELRVPEELLQPLGDGVYYQHQLVGCVVDTTTGARVGVVRKVDGGAGGSLLVVEGARGEVLVPFAADICVAVDVAAGRITVEPPAGLLELNERKEMGSTPDPIKFDVVTIFPRMMAAGLAEGVVSRGIARGLIDVAVHDLREYTTDRHRTVDDVPYGGGPGMVMKAEPLVRAVDRIREARGVPDAVILLTPQGRLFRQAEAERLSRLSHVTLLCGRYEGIDERVRELVVTEELSIGDYVLSGGELAALVIVDAVSRLVPGVVGDEQSVEQDSFSRGLLDYPHYTRPAEVGGRKVPDVLLSGHHADVRRWRRRAALERTLERRPELLAEAALDDDDRRLLDEIRRERKT